jgi:hypothetical protein
MWVPALVAGPRTFGHQRKRDVEVRGFDDPEAGSPLLGLDERASVETGSSPRPSITVEVVGSASPAAKTQLPPAISFSVKTSIAACSSAVPDSLR